MASENNSRQALVLIGGIIAALLLVLIIILVVFFLNRRDTAPTPPALQQEQAFDPGPAIRPDIARPAFPSKEAVPFPGQRNFVSSGSNFQVQGASNTYFAYVPSEHWGVYIMLFDQGFWSTRYLYCAEYDSASRLLVLNAYNPDGSYVGNMAGYLARSGNGYIYDCTFTNYKGWKNQYHIVSDY